MGEAVCAVATNAVDEKIKNNKRRAVEAKTV